MRAFVYAWAASLALASVPGDAAPPRRVASLNLCTDELLLMLGSPGQIASVTHLSHKQAETVLWRAARRSSLNDGSLLSVTRLRPELVLTMGGSGGDKAGIARRLGFRILNLPYPHSVADVERNVATVASALHRQQAGRALLARIAVLTRSRPIRTIDTVWMGGGGRSVAATGLAAEWMGLAGLKQRALSGDRIGREELLTRPPALLLRSDYRSGQFSAEQSWLRHAFGRGARSRVVATDGRRWTCMGPSLIEEIARLRRVTA